MLFAFTIIKDDMADSFFYRLKDLFSNKYNNEYVKEAIKEQNKKKYLYEPIGTSGTEIYGGYLEEEYLGELRDNRDKYEAYKRMINSDGTIRMCVKTFVTPIMGAKWSYKIKDEFADDPMAEKQLEFMMKAYPKPRKLIEILISSGTYGFALAERYWEKFNYEGQTKLRPKLKYILQRTIEEWQMEDDELIAIRQETYGDSGANVIIAADRLIHYAINREANDFEGDSLLRPCYGSWLRKQANYKKVAIGNHFMSLPFLKIYNEGMGEVPAEDLQRLGKRLSDRANPKSTLSHVIFPKGYKADEQTSSHDPIKLYECNDREDTQMVRAFLANFLLLTKGSGSFALSNDLSDFFLKHLESIGKDFDDIGDKELVEKTIMMNFDEECMIELTHSEIGGKGGAKFADSINKLVSSGVIKKDEVLEKYIRNKFDLPVKDYETEEKPMMQNPMMPTDKENNDGSMDEKNIDDAENKKDEKEKEKEMNMNNISLEATKAEMKSQARKSAKRIKGLREKIKMTLYKQARKEIIEKKANIK